MGLVAKLAGHANASVTLGHYTQAVRGGEAAVAALDEAGLTYERVEEVELLPRVARDLAAKIAAELEKRPDIVKELQALLAETRSSGRSALRGRTPFAGKRRAVGRALGGSTLSRPAA